MGDMREVYDDMKAHSKEKKLSNIESARELFKHHNIDYEEKNNGVHWIVVSPLKDNEIVDYYPSTGKWIYRKGGTGRGVLNLLRKFRLIKGK